jgi:hypothetical protein
MASKDEILVILNNIQQGKISPEEGLTLMNTLRGTDPSIAGFHSADPSAHASPQEINADQAVYLVPPAPIHPDPQTFESNSGPVAMDIPAQVNLNGHAPFGGVNQSIEATPRPKSESQAKSPEPERVSGELVGEKDAEREIHYWKRWWLWPFWIGTALTFFGALIMYLGYEAAHFGFFFWVALFPFFFGVLIVAISWQNRMVHWLHVRIHQKPGEKPGTLSISLPIPIGLMGWFLRNFSHLIPGLHGQKLNGNDFSEILSELGKNVSPENPFYVHVNGDNGEEVEVFIG